MIHPIIALEEKRGLLHDTIKARLITLITEASSGIPLNGYGRIIETLEELAEHHDDPTIKSMAPHLTAALTEAFTDKPFSMIDYHDTRSIAELDSTYGHE